MIRRLFTAAIVFGIGAAPAGVRAQAATARVHVRLVEGPCGSSVEVGAIETLLAAEPTISVETAASADALVATWGEAPCEPAGEIRVVLGDADGSPLAGPIVLELTTFDSTLRARVIALWFAEALRRPPVHDGGSASSAAPPPEPLVPPAAGTSARASPSSSRSMARALGTPGEPPEPRPPHVRGIVAAWGGLFAPLLVGGRVAIDLRTDERYLPLLEVDVGGAWGPVELRSIGRVVDVQAFVASIALLEPFDVDRLFGLEVGARATLGVIGVGANEPGAHLRDDVVALLGASVRAFLPARHASFFVELEVGGPLVPAWIEPGEGAPAVPFADGAFGALRLGASLE